MHKLARTLIRTGVTLLVGHAAAHAAAAADFAIVDVPQGMILETRLASRVSATAATGKPIDFVVTHDLRVGEYVVIAAGSHGIGHLAVDGRARGPAHARRIRYDYVLASDGTRIPVAGTLPYLTTRATRTVVIYSVAGANGITSGVPIASRTKASLTRP